MQEQLGPCIDVTNEVAGLDVEYEVWFSKMQDIDANHVCGVTRWGKKCVGTKLMSAQLPQLLLFWMPFIWTVMSIFLSMSAGDALRRTCDVIFSPMSAGFEWWQFFSFDACSMSSDTRGADVNSLASMSTGNKAWGIIRFLDGIVILGMFLDIRPGWLWDAKVVGVCFLPLWWWEVDKGEIELKDVEIRDWLGHSQTLRCTNWRKVIVQKFSPGIPTSCKYWYWWL